MRCGTAAQIDGKRKRGKQYENLAQKLSESPVVRYSKEYSGFCGITDDGNNHNIGHEICRPQGASSFLGDLFAYSVTSEGAGLQP